MSKEFTHQRESQYAPCTASCPYFDESGSLCRASISTLHIDGRRRRIHCATDDHDDCAIYLSKMLRSRRPVAFALQSREIYCNK